MLYEVITEISLSMAQLSMLLEGIDCVITSYSIHYTKLYDKDVVKAPKGYHPVATIAGYDSYYLNVMAGPSRKWLFTWEKDHEWVNGPVYKENRITSYNVCYTKLLR